MIQQLFPSLSQPHTRACVAGLEALTSGFSEFIFEDFAKRRNMKSVIDQGFLL